MATSSEYKKLIEGFLGGLLLAAGGGNREKISSMLPKKKSDFTHSLNFTYSNQGYVPNSVSQWLDFGKRNQDENKSVNQNAENTSSSSKNNSVSTMVSSNGGTTPTNAETKWIFIANPNCCPKCLSMNGRTEIGPKEPLFYGHVPDREGRFNCRCHWVRMS